MIIKMVSGGRPGNPTQNFNDLDLISLAFFPNLSKKHNKKWQFSLVRVMIPATC